MNAPELPALRATLPVWGRIALLSFGGPAGQIAVMHKILVDEKRWISDARFLHALNYCMLLPGPEAMQLVTFVGWLMYRTPGGLIAGGLFVLPGLVSIMGLSIIYASYGTVPAISAVFFGLKSAVLVIVISALLRLGKRLLKAPAKILIAASAFVGIFIFAVPFPMIILSAAVLGYFGARQHWSVFLEAQGHGSAAETGDSLLGDWAPPHAVPNLGVTLKTIVIWSAVWIFPTLFVIFFFGKAHIFAQIALFFSKMAVVTFGGAYAVLAYVAQQAVENHHWLSAPEMLDGLGMAETTPGPLIIVLQFVGFLGAYRGASGFSPILGGCIGGLIATWVTFVPCFLWVFAGGPFVEALRSNKSLNGALAAITAAIVGVVLNLSLWLAIHTLFAATVPIRSLGMHFDQPVWFSLNIFALALTLAAAIGTFRFKLSIPAVLGLCAAASLAARGLNFL